jgi:hypothetical protein
MLDWVVQALLLDMCFALLWSIFCLAFKVKPTGASRGHIIPIVVDILAEN